MQTADRERIVILGANVRECSLMVDALSKAGLPAAQCGNMEELCGCLRHGATAAIVAENALSDGSLDQLSAVLRDDPERCGPPLLVITDGNTLENSPRLGTPLLIQRPIPVSTLVSWARAALKAAEDERHVAVRLREQTQAAQRARDELAERKTELKRLNVDVEQFVFSASHELREPLRNLALYSEKLRRNPDLALDEDTRQCLSIILTSAARMELLFRDLLAFMQVSAGIPARDVETDANAVLEGVLRKMQGLMRATGAAIYAGPLPQLSMAETHVANLLENLIENAIKYRMPGVKPEIHIFASEAGGESTIRVRDNGLGIGPEHQEKVFGLFKRLHSSEEYEGTGLGLAICQKIAEQYRGRIWVESELGKGATFCFRLPHASSSPHALSAVSA